MLTGGRGIGSVFESVDLLPLKLNQLPPVRSDFHEILQEDLPVNISKSVEDIFDIFCPNEATVDFLNLQDKLEPPTLIRYAVVV